MQRRVYVISDLHLGGAWGETPGARGFRINTQPEVLADFVAWVAGRPHAAELVINGDFVDFLAEQRGDGWAAFEALPGEAVRTFEAIANRYRADGEGGDAAVFDALGVLITAGKQLTVVLGNHDLELALPAVRRALLARIGAVPGQVRFVLDDEAYVIGDAVIEHGNRADDFNRVDHAGLAHLRANQSRGGIERAGPAFVPPPGSRMVAEVMNEVKQALPFVDLLKPEGAALYGFLLAFEPKLKETLWRAGPIVAKAKLVPEGHRYERFFKGTTRSGAGDAPDPMLEAIQATLGAEAAAEAGSLVQPDDVVTFRGPIDDARLAWSFLALLAGGRRKAIESRLKLLQPAMARLSADVSFQRDQIDGKSAYYGAALAMRDQGVRWVVFGHTHHAKCVPMGRGAGYINTGTWADRMRFPSEVLGAGDAGLEALRAFFERVKAGTFEVLFQPTYACLTVDASGRVDATLESWPRQ
jgi:UDP-2,3-diacylglucosamine pyrophosphatase LpxH